LSASVIIVTRLKAVQLENQGGPETFLFHTASRPALSFKSITNSMSWALLERSPVVWTLDTFPAFHGTRTFTTEFTRALHLSLSSASPHHAIPPLQDPSYPPMCWSS
jgi:hypothetical protein